MKTYVPWFIGADSIYGNGGRQSEYPSDRTLLKTVKGVKQPPDALRIKNRPVSIDALAHVLRLADALPLNDAEEISVPEDIQRLGSTILHQVGSSSIFVGNDDSERSHGWQVVREGSGDILVSSVPKCFVTDAALEGIVTQPLNA